ncbi:MAG: hypothetical protein J6R84_02035 [Alistipes sp.]|nr:hypothetical protein [Alistipes sp.]
MKTWLLPHPCKKAGQVLLFVMLALIFSSIYIESALFQRSSWLMIAAQIAIYVAIVMMSISREKDEDEMTSSLRGRALKEVGYCLLVIYALSQIIEVAMGEQPYILRDEELITPFLAWVAYYCRFEGLLKRSRKREFTL